jgi:uncharacterized protein YkwD
MFAVLGLVISWPFFTNYEKPEHNVMEYEVIKTSTKKIEVSDKPIKKINKIETNQKSNLKIQEIEIQIHEKINNERQKNGLKKLNWNESIANLARDHSKDMGTKKYFSHTTPSGKTPYDRFVEKNIQCELLGGENIYMTGDFTNEEPNIVVREWMNSPLHKINILDERYTVQGIGVYITNNNEGYITQNFC